MGTITDSAIRLIGMLQLNTEGGRLGDGSYWLVAVLPLKRPGGGEASGDSEHRPWI